MSTAITPGYIERLLDEADTRARQNGALPGCDVSAMSFPADAQKEWARSAAYRRRLLASSPAGSFVQRVLKQKAAVRPRRFWGEALVATAAPVEAGWYSSYKWLTSPSWTSGAEPSDPMERAFKKALRSHLPELPAVQDVARRYARRYGVKPVAPDLWLLRNDRHWFLESKILPGDSLSEAQLAGLAVIATYWPGVNVGVVYLQPEGAKMHPLPDDVHTRFWRHCRRVATVAPREARAVTKKPLRASEQGLKRQCQPA